jgi:peptide-methionine (S)-S-oxide reductase
MRVYIYREKWLMKNVFKVSVVSVILLVSNIAERAHAQTDSPAASSGGNYKYATFAAGCFWCEEYVFEGVKGVVSALPGYAGGTQKKPTYEQVSDGKTGHAESVNVYYDPSVVSYATLLKVFFASQDPTQVDAQGPDKGSQYRSIVFYRNATEQQEAQKYVEQLNKSGKYKNPIATQLVPYTMFWPAENYHIQYIQHHPRDPYVVQESKPRVERFQQQFPELIKPKWNLMK